MNTNSVESIALQQLNKDLAKRRVSDLSHFWQMMPAEKMAMVGILSQLKPDVAIEIGTAEGGSLATISNYAKKVYSLDIDTNCERKLKKRFKNVKFHSGDSAKNIPAVLAEIEKQKRDLQFVLIDGDHSREGVRRDINAILKYKPRKPMVIILHDGFNPPCRYGMLDAKWSQNRHVQSVNLDFVPGVALQILDSKGTVAPLPFKPEMPVWMYRGLAAAYLTPQPRKGPLAIQEPGRWLFDKVWPQSIHAAIRFGFGSNDNANAGHYDFFANRSESQMQAYLAASGAEDADNEPSGFIQIRKLLLPKIKKWSTDGKKLAIYGAGKHTLALLGLVPELYSQLSVFIDKNATGSYLSKPSVTPEKFKPSLADTVIYSSKAFEKEMHKNFRHHKVEHVRLYS